MSHYEYALQQIPKNVSRWLYSKTPFTLNHIGKNTEFYFIGTGSSLHGAQWMSHLFSQWGHHSQYLSTWNLLHLCSDINHAKLKMRSQLSKHSKTAKSMQTEPVKKHKHNHKQLYILISHRGAKGLTSLAIDMLQNKGVQKKQILLIAAEDSLRPPHGIAVMPTCPTEKSQAHSIGLFQAMGQGCMLLRMVNESFDDCAKIILPKLASYLEKHKKSALKLPKKRLKHLYNASALYFIGDGQNESIASELSLKWREIMHEPSHFMAQEEFLHGPLASVYKDDDFIHFTSALPPSLPRRDRALIKSLRQLQTITPLSPPLAKIGPQSFLHDYELSWQWAKSLGYLYWGQWIICQTAKLYNINPDLNHREDPRYDKAFQQSQI